MTVYGAALRAEPAAVREQSAADRIKFLMQAAHIGFELTRGAPPFALPEPGSDAPDQHAENKQARR